MLPISSPPIRYSTTELTDKRISIDSLRHQRSDFSIMVVLFQSGLLLRNLARFKEMDDDLDAHMEGHGEFALAEYIKRSLDSNPVIYTKEPMPVHRPIDLERDRQPEVVIEKSLASFLPISSIDLVNSYLDQHDGIFAHQKVWNQPDNYSFKRTMLRKIVANGDEPVLNELFDQFRRQKQPINLSYVDLTGLNLTKFNWSGVNRSNADLTEANLTQVNLSWANLSCAELTGANLSGAVLHNANLISADLTLANCEYADLSETNLASAILHRANMRCATLLRANLTNASMIRCSLNRARLDRSDLQNADLTNAAMAGTSLFRANLCGAKMNFCYLAHANLEHANLTDTSLQSAYLFNSRLHNATMTQTSFWNANLAVATGLDNIPDDIEKATASLSRFASRIPAHQRRIVTEDALAEELPTSIVDLISAYDGYAESRKLQTFSEQSGRSLAHFKHPEIDYAPVTDMESRCRNRQFVIDALMSSDVRLKEAIIRNLISKDKVRYLNKIFAEIRSVYGQIPLSWVDLSELNLSGLDLSCADLQRANLSGVKFNHARLSNLDLEKANLSAAVFIHTVMSRVVLLHADLSNATLMRCVIEFSVLGSANFSGAIIRARFHNNAMPFVDFSKAQFSFSQITRSHLTGVNLTDGILDGVNIRNSVLEDVESTNVRLIDTSKNKVKITEPAQLNDS